ncbi:hypothetical protein D3C87_1529480 [compost metagenome]
MFVVLFRSPDRVIPDDVPRRWLDGHQFVEVLFRAHRFPLAMYFSIFLVLCDFPLCFALSTRWPFLFSEMEWITYIPKHRIRVNRSISGKIIELC